jgi:large repetitive protein
MNCRPFVLALLFLVLLALPALAEQGAFTHFIGFDDTNGNGQLDCGEPVTIQAGYFSSGTTVKASGTVIAPTPGTIGLSYLGGSVIVTPDEEVGCTVDIASGLDPHDATFTADFTCDPLISNPPNQNFLSLTYKAMYTALAGSPGFTSAVLVETTDGNLLGKTESQTFPTETCFVAPTPLKISKTASGNAVPGSPVTFTLTATDTSSLGVGGVQLIDTVPANTTFDPALSTSGWACSPNPGPGSVCRIFMGNILGNTSASAIFAVTVASPLAAGVSSISNTACVSEGPSTIDDCSSVSVPTAGTPMLALAKSLASGTGSPGATLVYNLAVRNTGNQGATSVTLTETVPANTTFSPSASDAGWACTPSGAAGSTCTLAVGSLPAGASRSARFAVVIANPLPAGVQSVANTACAKSPDAPDDCHTVTVPTTGLPALNITKTLTSGDGTPGSTLLYAVSVQNTGNQGATSVVFLETVPANTSFDPTKSDPAWQCSSPAAGSSCTFTLPTLPAGSARKADFAVTVANPLPAGVMTIANTACASATGVSKTCSTVPITPNASPRITLTKSYGSGPIHPGDHLSFTLSATNSGNQDSEPLSLTDIVPANTTFDASSSSPGWACSPDTSAGSTCTLSLPGLPAGGTVTRTAAFIVTTLPPGVSQVANTACIAESAPAPRSRIRSSSTCSQVTTPPAAKVASTLTAIPRDANHNGAADPGEALSYTLELRCTSTTSATGLSITPHLDSNLHFVAGSVTTTAGTIATGNGPADGTFKVDLASLASGGSVTITFDAVIDRATTAKSVSTQAFAAGTNFPLDASDDPATPAPDDPTVTPLSAPLIAEVPALGPVGLLTLILSLGVAGTAVLWKFRL